MQTRTPERAPPYPSRVWELLEQICPLEPTTRVLEIGPGNGLATSELRRRGAVITCVEPDRRFEAYLSDLAEVHWTTFQDAPLAAASFDLCVAANSFHWVKPQDTGLQKVSQVLTPGGRWFAFWSIHGGPRYHDPLDSILGPVVGDVGEGSSPFTLDTRGRVADLLEAGFTNVRCEAWTWEWSWSSADARALYATFGRVMALSEADRQGLLDRIEESVAANGGTLSRLMTTVVYSAVTRLDSA